MMAFKWLSMKMNHLLLVTINIMELNLCTWLTKSGTQQAHFLLPIGFLDILQFRGLEESLSLVDVVTTGHRSHFSRMIDGRNLVILFKEEWISWQSSMVLMSWSLVEFQRIRNCKFVNSSEMMIWVRIWSKLGRELSVFIFQIMIIYSRAKTEIFSLMNDGNNMTSTNQISIANLNLRNSMFTSGIIIDLKETSSCKITEIGKWMKFDHTIFLNLYHISNIFK